MTKVYKKEQLPAAPSGMYWRGLVERVLSPNTALVNWSAVVRVETASTPNYICADHKIDFNFTPDNYLYQGPIPWPKRSTEL